MNSRVFWTILTEKKICKKLYSHWLNCAFVNFLFVNLFFAKWIEINDDGDIKNQNSGTDVGWFVNQFVNFNQNVNCAGNDRKPFRPDAQTLQTIRFDKTHGGVNQRQNKQNFDVGRIEFRYSFDDAMSEPTFGVEMQKTDQSSAKATMSRCISDKIPNPATKPITPFIAS